LGGTVLDLSNFSWEVDFRHIRRRWGWEWDTPPYWGRCLRRGQCPIPRKCFSF